MGKGLERRVGPARVLLVVLLLAGLALAGGPAARANGTNGIVDTTCDEAELDAELAALPAGGTLTFACGDVTIPLSGRKTLTGNRTLDGGGRVTLDGRWATPILHVPAGESATVAGVTVDRPESWNNEGGVAVEGRLLLRDSTVRRGRVTYAVYNTGQLQIARSLITDNQYSAIGNTGTLHVIDSTVANNTSPASGGGIYSIGVLIVTNSTISGNSTPWNGGGIASYGSATITGSTIVDNVNQGLATNFSSIWITSTIVAGNSGGNCVRYIPNSLSRFNLSDDTSCWFTDASDRQSIDPLLSPLGLHGGELPVHVPLAGSPAIDAAGAAPCASASDQRGTARPVGAACDIGAIEALGPTAPTAPGAPVLIAGDNPNRGSFTLSWEPASDTNADALSYTLEVRDANDPGYVGLVSGLAEPSASITGAPEGSLRFRVRASDGALDGPWTESDTAIVIDRTRPNMPLIVPDRAPDGNGWYRGPVTIAVVSDGDPDLPDGTPGSGVDPESLPAPFTLTETTTFSVMARDRAGNDSWPIGATIQIDNTAPLVTMTCPVSVEIGEEAYASWTAWDEQSGVATTSGEVRLDTTTRGTKTAHSPLVSDNVGNQAQASCSYDVIFDFGGFTGAVANPIATNVMRAGETVAVSFSLGGYYGMDILRRRPVTSPTSCTWVTHQVSETTTGGKASLGYDAATGLYTWTYVTDRRWANSCRALQFDFVDGTSRPVFFKFTK